MVCMGLRMSTRFPIQKSAPPSCFPPPQPRNAKIEPNGVPTLYEEGSWGPQNPATHPTRLCFAAG
jgi:hypothetical protein